MSILKIKLFGAFQVTQNNKSVVRSISDKSRALLAYIAVESHRSHRREYLAGLLWPDQPEKKSLHNLRQALSSLRKFLQDDQRDIQFILVTRASIQFNPHSPYTLDVNEFDDLINKSLQYYKPGDEESRIHARPLIQAASLFKGHFLDQFFLEDSIYFEEWSTLRRENYSRKILQALNLLVEVYERQGDYYHALQYASRMVELAPWEENAHRIVMRLLALNGQWSAAADQYRSCLRYLKEELGLDPTKETNRLFEDIRDLSAQAEEIPTRFPPVQSNLPAFPNSFVGREQELDDVADMLADPHCRLLTIMGPGGIGKTRLAIEAAREQIGLFQDGVFYVSLGDIHSNNHIISTISEAFNFRFTDRDTPKSQLLEYIRKKKILLLIDNFEHLIDQVELISEFLASAPELIIITTTRERLNLKEEWLLTLEGLNYPHALNLTLPELKKFEAVTLFETCAKKIIRDFKITPSEQESIIRICQLVEGNPLAVEMAAASILSRSCSEIASQLEDNLSILTTSLHNIQPRQSSMTATIQYSWDLLSEIEQRKFSRLAVFQGEFDARAAEIIGEVDQEMISTLINKSLVRKTDDGKFEIHRLLRKFAEEKLSKDIHECQSIEFRYCDYYLDLLTDQAIRLNGKEQIQALQEINKNIENIINVWHILVSQKKFPDIEQIVEPIYRFHVIRSLFEGGIELFKEALSSLVDEKNQEKLKNTIVARQGAMYQRFGQYALAKKYLEQGLCAFRSINESSEIIFCLVQLGNTEFKMGNYTEVQQLAKEALELAISIEDLWGITSSYYLLGHSAYRTGNIEQGKEDLEKCLEYSRTSDKLRLLLTPLNALGDIACHQGDYAKATQIYKECIQISKILGDHYRAGIHFNNLGTVYHNLENYLEAEKYYLESLEICEEIGDSIGQAIAFSNLGEIALSRNEYTEAKRLYDAGLQIGRDLEDHWTILACLKNLGEISLIQQEFMDAKTFYTEAFEVGTKLNTKPLVLNMLVDLAEYTSTNGNPDLAGEMLTLVLKHPSSEEFAREKANQLLEINVSHTKDFEPRPIEVLIKEGLRQLPNSGIGED